MPAKYHAVAPTLWDRTMRELTGPAKVVRLYLMTCPARVSEGLYHLPLGHLIHDTGLKAEHVDQALADLDAAGLVSYDRDAEVVLDRTALKFYPLKHGRDLDTGEVKRNKAMTSAVRLFASVPPSPLKRELYLLAKQYAEDYADALANHDESLRADPSHVSPTEGGWKGDGRGTDGGSRAREELEQELELDKSRAREEPDQGSEEEPSCSWCGDPAKIEKTGRTFDYQGRPWCGWCEPSEDGDAA